jgi:DNA repair protein RecO (recombination protein O)
MIASTTGLILRTRPLTETSLIVQWLSKDFGRIDTVAKGARRPKSPFRGKLDLFYEADFSFVRSPRSELHTLREVSLRETNAALRQELGRLRQASYAAVLIKQTTEKDTPLPRVFELLRGLLGELTQRAPQAQTILAFEMKLLQELGQKPDLAKARLTPGAKKLMVELTKRDWPALPRLALSRDQAREIQQFLHGFLIFHLGRIPKGRAAALNQ